MPSARLRLQGFRYCFRFHLANPSNETHLLPREAHYRLAFNLSAFLHAFVCVAFFSWVHDYVSGAQTRTCCRVRRMWASGHTVSTISSSLPSAWMSKRILSSIHLQMCTR